MERKSFPEFSFLNFQFLPHSLEWRFSSKREFPNNPNLLAAAYYMLLWHFPTCIAKETDWRADRSQCLFRSWFTSELFQDKINIAMHFRHKTGGFTKILIIFTDQWAWSAPHSYLIQINWLGLSSILLCSILVHITWDMMSWSLSNFETQLI